MRLRDAEDGHSVYVLYSDLLFNLVIIFLVLVLALVLRLNSSLQSVAAREQALTAPASELAVAKASVEKLTRERDAAQRTSVGMLKVLTQEREQLAKAERDLAESKKKQIEEANALKAKLDKFAAENERQQAEAASQLKEVGQRLSIAAGANRFSGRSGGTSLCVAIDLTGRTPKYVLMDASIFSSAHSQLDGESDAEHSQRSARLLIAAARGAVRYSAEELEPLFKALQVRVGGDDSRHEGRLTFRFSIRGTAAASGWLDLDGDLDQRRALIGMERFAAIGTFSDFHSAKINSLLELRDRLRPKTPPESVPVLHFSVPAGGGQTQIVLAGTKFDIGPFREMVRAFGDGGIILQYDGAAGEVAPDWVIRNVLTPTGYTNSVPDPDAIKKLEQNLRSGTQR